MTTLNPTPPRLALMRAVAAGEWQVSRDGDQKLALWHNGDLSTDTRLVGRFHDLAHADLVQRVPFLFEGQRPALLTTAGREWLAEHDKETTR